MARILLTLLEKIFTCAHPHSKKNLTEAMHNYRYYYYKYNYLHIMLFLVAVSKWHIVQFQTKNQCDLSTYLQPQPTL